jgi:hypothetical protein
MDDVLRIIVALTPLMIVMLAGFVALYTKLDSLHRQTNSMKDELIISTRNLAHAQGVSEEHERSLTAAALHTEAVAEGAARERARTSDSSPLSPH